MSHENIENQFYGNVGCCLTSAKYLKVQKELGTGHKSQRINKRYTRSIIDQTTCRKTQRNDWMDDTKEVIQFGAKNNIGPPTLVALYPSNQGMTKQKH